MDVEGIKQEHQLISEKEQVEKQNMTPMMMMMMMMMYRVSQKNALSESSSCKPTPPRD